MTHIFALVISNDCQILQVSASNSTSRRIRHSSTLETFLRQSVHHCLSNAEVLAKSFRKSGADAQLLSEESLLDIADYKRLLNSFTFLRYMTGSLVYDSLWQCLQSLYVPPSEIIFRNTVGTKSQPQLRSGPSHNVEHYEDVFSSQYTRQDFSNYDGKPYISDLDAAHIVFICLCALGVTRIYDGTSNTIGNYENHEFLSDHVHDESSRRLFHQLIKAVAARRCYWNIQRTILNSQSEEPEVYSFPLVSILSNHIRKVDNMEKTLLYPPLSPSSFLGTHLPLSLFLSQYLTVEFYNHWDGSDTIKRWDLVGGIIELFAGSCDTFINNLLTSAHQNYRNSKPKNGWYSYKALSRSYNYNCQIY